MNGDFDIWYLPATFCPNFSFQVYTEPFQWRPLIYIEKTCDRVLEVNKKQVPLKSYSLGNKNRFCQSYIEEQRKSYINL